MLLVLAGCQPLETRRATDLQTPKISVPRTSQVLAAEESDPTNSRQSATIKREDEIRQVAFETESEAADRARFAAPGTDLDSETGEDHFAQPAADASLDRSSFANELNAPRTVDDEMPTDFWDLSLDEAIRTGLQNANVLRNLGGQVLTNPQAATTKFEPALQYTDPVFGVDAALSQFDAQLSSNATYSKNDDVFNNPFTGGGLLSPSKPVEVERENFDWNVQLTKTAATGAQFSLTRALHHDYQNPQLANFFVGSWSNYIEGSIRQPLLQGRGVMFNRIAGPNGQPGFRFSNGVIIAQINDKISAATFEQGVQAYADQVISAYWQLYLAYRNYEAAVRARDTGYKTWRIAEARFQADLPGGEADREAQAREQMLAFEQEVMTALSGDQRTGVTGVYQAEANLRLLLGLPIRDSQFIRPSEEPVEAKIIYDWDHLSNIASNNRLELQQQKLRVKQEEMQLLASKNFLLPRLDAVATYRHYGFGDHLFNGPSVDDQGLPVDRFSSSLKDYYNGDHHQMQVGLQLNVPLGYRRQFAGLRNAELSLRRERAILEEQQAQIQFQLGNAVRQTALDYQALRNAYNRLVAADQAEQSRFVSFEADKSPLDFLLEAQSRRAQAENAYHRAVVNYQLGRTQIQNEAGVLLSNLGVQFSRETADR